MAGEGNPIAANPDQTTTNSGTVAKTFTQDDIDRIVQERLARERAKYSDYDELKKAADKLKSVEDAGKSDMQKLADQVAEIRTQLGLKDQTINQLKGEVTASQRQRLAFSIASALAAHDPTDANILTAIGDVDPAATDAEARIKAKLEALKQAKPYLFRSGTTQLAGLNPGSTTGNTTGDAERLKRLYQRAGVATSPFG